MLDEHERLRRELDPSPRLHEERDPGLALEQAQLLRHGRRAVGEGLGDGRQGAASAELDQEAKASHIEHRDLPGNHQIIRLYRTVCVGFVRCTEQTPRRTLVGDKARDLGAP